VTPEERPAARAIPRKINFTEARLRDLACPPGRKIAWVYDQQVGALAFAVTANGSRSFYFYRWHNGRPVRKSIGKLDKMSVDDARKKVQKLNAAYNEGRDAVAEEKRVSASQPLGDLWAAYQRKTLDATATPQTLRSESSLYGTCLEPWAARRIDAITATACGELHAKLGTERGHRTANRALQLLRRLYRAEKLPVPFDADSVKWF